MVIDLNSFDEQRQRFAQRAATQKPSRQQKFFLASARPMRFTAKNVAQTRAGGAALTDI